MVGYEINKQKRYCIKFQDCIVIGAYECQFNKRSSFIYTALTALEGLFIRKEKWNEMTSEAEELGRCIKRNLLVDYLLNIRVKVNVNKKRSVSVIKNRRSDF